MDSEKYINTILYFCKHLGGHIDGKKKLAKLLYFADFDRYEYKESMRSITGDVYCKLPMGPVPDAVKNNFSSMRNDFDNAVREEKKNIGYENDIIRYTALKDPDMNKFDSDDILILKRVINKYGNLTGMQLETLSHSEAPYIAASEREEIPLDLTFYRGTDFSDI